MDSNRQRRKGRARNEILMQSGVWKIIMELHYGTIKLKERRHYRTKRKMNVLHQIFHILISTDLLISISIRSQLHSRSLLHPNDLFNYLHLISKQSNYDHNGVLRDILVSCHILSCAHFMQIYANRIFSILFSRSIGIKLYTIEWVSRQRLLLSVNFIK